MKKKNYGEVGIVLYIDAAHSLPGHPKCGSVHGHTYTVEVLLKGTIRNNMIVDFSHAKQVFEEILSKYDHKCLNDFLSYPTVENFVQQLFKDASLVVFPPNVKELEIRVWEGENKWFRMSSTL